MTAEYQAKRLNWELLKQWAQLGVVCLKYLDESGCCLRRAGDYAYSPRGQQKRVKQCKRIVKPGVSHRIHPIF